MMTEPQHCDACDDPDCQGFAARPRRRSALVTCPHDWVDRGTPGDRWRECWLCGADQEAS